MKTKTTFLILFILIFTALVTAKYMSFTLQKELPKEVKIRLRDSVHKLLLTTKDSTSLILPIIELDKDKYKIAFENNLFINPDSLVSSISRSLNSNIYFKNYIVEVTHCDNDEVVYSYQIKENVENNIIPCLGRVLPVDCYTILVSFTSNPISLFNQKQLLIILLVLGGINLVLFYRDRSKKEETINTDNHFIQIGDYKFYPNKNELIKPDSQVSLSVKECELLKIFSENQNQIIKREFLIKEVWEDKGVYVDRSLDTFISKLRKKLKDDTSVSIVNIHGVGYKLKVSKD